MTGSGGDAVHEQHRSVAARDTRPRTGGQVRAAHRPFAVAQPDAAGTVLQALLEHDHLADVTVAGAMAGERAVVLTLLLAVLPPEVEREHAAGEKDEPDHGTTSEE